MKRGLALFVTLTSCTVDLQIPDGANIACRSDDDCPSSSICDMRNQCRSAEVAAKGVPGFDINPLTVTVGESGTPTSVNVRLTAQPSAPVTVVLAADDGSEAFISKNVLTFTPDDFAVAQTVTVTGERDCLADGAIASHILVSPAQSQDPDYNGLDAPDVEVTTEDDVPSAGIVVTPTTGLATDETGDVTQFTVVVACRPTANVQFTLASTDDTEGFITVSDLTFTPDNWAVPRIINVFGKGDCASDGDVPYAIDLSAVASDDPLYTGIDPPNVELVNHDVAFSRVNITPNTGLRTSEGLTQTTFSVVLTCQPTANVVVPIGTGDASEGTIGAVTSLTFTPDDWDDAQAVIVTGVNDDYDDGNIAYTIVTSAMTSTDAGFAGLDPIDVALTNDDNDTAGITVSAAAGHSAEPSTGTSFSVTLDAAPLSPVSFSISSSNTAEATVVAGPLVYNAKGTFLVSVNAVDDFVDDDNQTVTITLGTASSADPAFNGIDVADVTVINDDNDTAGWIRWDNGLYVSETGTTDEFRMAPATKPTADITCTIYDEFDNGEVRVGATGTGTLSWTPVDYGLLKSVTVTGLDDGMADGLGRPSVGAHCTSSDAKYNNTTYYVVAYNLEPASSKRFYTTPAPPNLTGANVGNSATADGICQANNPVGPGIWKAVIANSARRACATANCSTAAGNNLDWVLQPSFTYYWPGMNGIVGTTNAAGIFTVQYDGTPHGTGSTGWGGVWTGMNGDFTSSGNNCSNWTSNSGSGMVGLEGQFSNINNTWGWDPGVVIACGDARRIYCAEQ